jgi:thioredoxin-like negative regulator of GroEL
VYFDTEFSAADAYQIYSIPVTVFVRADGTIAAQQIGAMQESNLRAYLEDLLAE